MKYTVKPSKRFSKELRKAEKRGYNIDLITKVIKILAEGKPLPPKYKDHALTGNYKGCRECHITPDWLLIYEIVETERLILKTLDKKYAKNVLKMTNGNIIYIFHW